jgi:hypothetical protein
MSTSTQAPLEVGSPGITAAYLLWLLAALAAGVFPRVIYQGHLGASTTLPTLSVLTAGVMSFLLLAWPIRLMAVQGRSSWSAMFAQAGVDVLLGAAMLVPFVVVATFLSDGGWADGIRCVLAVGACVPLAALMGMVMGARGPLRPWVLLTGLIATLGAPAGVYVLREFFAASPRLITRVWLGSPVGFAFQQGSAGEVGPLPGPLWPMLLWAGLTVAGGLIALAASRDSNGAKSGQE